MKIGVTSQNFRTITGHAGKARRFMIFEVSNGQVCKTGEFDLPKEMSIHEHPAGAAHPLDNIDVLITASCGEGFLMRLAERGVKVILTGETDPFAAVSAAASGASLPPPAAEEEEAGGCQCHCAAAARIA